MTAGCTTRQGLFFDFRDITNPSIITNYRIQQTKAGVTQSLASKRDWTSHPYIRSPLLRLPVCSSARISVCSAAASICSLLAATSARAVFGPCRHRAQIAGSWLDLSVADTAVSTYNRFVVLYQHVRYNVISCASLKRQFG